MRRNAAKELPAEEEIVLAGWLGPIGSLGTMHKQIARRRNNAWEAFLSGFWYEPVEPDYWWPLVPSQRTPAELESLVAADDMETLLLERESHE